MARFGRPENGCTGSLPRLYNRVAMAQGSGHATELSQTGTGVDGNLQGSWRSHLLQGLLCSAAVAFASVATFTFTDMGAIDGRVFAAGGLVTLALVFTRRWLSYSARVAVFLFVVSACGLYGLSRLGHLPNTSVAFSFASVAATLLIGVRAGVSLVLFFAAALVVVPGLQRTGIITRIDDWAQFVDSASAENVARVATNFLVLSSSSVVGISYLLRRGERLLRQRTRSFEQLALEQAEKERAQADLAQRETAYRKAAELEILGRLSGSVAHDFNNALLVIFASVDQISNMPLAPEIEEAVDAIRAAATQAASTTRQLRAFGPASPTSASLLMLGPAVRRLATLLGRVLPSSIVLSLAVDDEVAIIADESQIQRMLTNLVLNARDAMREGGRVSLRVQRVTTEPVPSALIEVEDNGAGMSDEVMRHLLEPFFTTKGSVGTGLGLVSVRALVEAAGGRVDATSQLGVGTTLSVYWPLAESVTATAHPDDAVSIDGSGLNVLLVDDDVQVRTMLARGLRKLGFGVVEAGDGKDGLLLARRHRDPLHVLCTDCVMPGIPLRSLVDGFRASHPEGRVVVCSGYSPDQSGFDTAAADAFIAKPFRVAELARCLRGLG